MSRHEWTRGHFSEFQWGIFLGLIVFGIWWRYSYTFIIFHFLLCSQCNENMKTNDLKWFLNDGGPEALGLLAPCVLCAGVANLPANWQQTKELNLGWSLKSFLFRVFSGKSLKSSDLRGAFDFSKGLEPPTTGSYCDQQRFLLAPVHATSWTVLGFDSQSLRFWKPILCEAVSAFIALSSGFCGES